jgi:hypothetical protein
MAHSQKSQRDHARPHHQPQVNNAVIAEQIELLVSPAVYAQAGYYRQLGLRARVLNLPLMMAAVLTLLWRQVPSVHELTRLLAREDLLWCQAVKVSQQALSQRFLEFPSQLFERVLKELLPLLAQRSWQRKRPVPDSVRWAMKTYERVWIVDGSTLEALFRKLESLQSVPLGHLAGKIAVVLDLVTRLPVEVWLESHPYYHDSRFGSRLLDLSPQKTLLLLDRGFWDFSFFQTLVEYQRDFITRLKTGAKFTITKSLSLSANHRDQIIRLGSGYKGNPIVTVRLVEKRVGKAWYSYLTSVLDPTVLPPEVVIDLYGHRWRIEETFKTLKRLLGLSYLWTGSVNGIRLQVWATWLFYVILIDLADEVAEALMLPLERISVEMLFRGLYHFTQAHAKGFADDPVQYFIAPENRDLAVVKVERKPPSKLNLDPFPKSLTIVAFS